MGRVFRVNGSAIWTDGWLGWIVRMEVTYTGLMDP